MRRKVSGQRLDGNGGIRQTDEDEDLKRRSSEIKWKLKCKCDEQFQTETKELEVRKVCGKRGWREIADSRHQTEDKRI